MRSDIFNVCAISAAESTNQSAPFQSITMEANTIKQSMIIENGIFVYLFYLRCLKFIQSNIFNLVQ